MAGTTVCALATYTYDSFTLATHLMSTVGFKGLNVIDIKYIFPGKCHHFRNSILTYYFVLSLIYKWLIHKCL
jgi:hypothetical protein